MPQFFVHSPDEDPYGPPGGGDQPVVPTPAPAPTGGDSTVPGIPGAPGQPDIVPGDDGTGVVGGRHGGGSQGYDPGGGPSYRLPGVPTFTPPQFARPTLADAYNEPGYQFRARAGEDALQRSAAARGVLRTGGTLKDIVEYGQNFAANEYGQVFNRALSSYDRQYQGAHDAFAPQMAQYQARTQAEIARANALYQRQWDAYTFGHRGGGGGGGSTYYEPPPNPGSYVPGGDPGAPAAPPGTPPTSGGRPGDGYNETGRDPYQYY